MSHVRSIGKFLKSKPTIEGAGVSLKRVFGCQHVPQLDPFLLLDDFHPDKSGLSQSARCPSLRRLNSDSERQLDKWQI